MLTIEVFDNGRVFILRNGAPVASVEIEPSGVTIGWREILRKVSEAPESRYIISDYVNAVVNRTGE